MQYKTVVDSHIHILPGMDDGAGSWEEAIEMARAVAADGSTALVVTPHYIKSYQSTREKVDKALDVFRGYLVQAGLSLEIYPGAEISLSSEVPELLNKGVLPTINYTSYMLVELPFGEELAKSEKVISKLREAGIKPILAHPERHREVRAQPNWLSRFIEDGGLAQINADSLNGDRGEEVREFAEKLLELRQAHLLGSDAHNLQKRKPGMAKAIEVVRRVAGGRWAAFMAEECPVRVLAGQPL